MSGIAIAVLLSAAAVVPAVPDGPASAVSASTWERVAQCESGGDWAADTGNGYFGGLQFTKASWLGAGGGTFAATADLATKDQQIAIAENLLRTQGPGAWPICGERAGLGAGEAASHSPPPPAAPPKAPPARTSYRVVPGDTLSGIAEKLHIPGGWRALFSKNKHVIANPDLIHPGLVLEY